MSDYKIKIGDNEYEVSVNEVQGSTASVTVNGTTYDVDFSEKERAAAPAAVPEAPVLQAQNPERPVSNGKERKISSPLPGVIVEIDVKEGDSVAQGQKVAVLEAMKMENEIQAESAGTVTKVHVSVGDSVLEGADIVTIS